MCGGRWRQRGRCSGDGGRRDVGGQDGEVEDLQEPVAGAQVGKNDVRVVDRRGCMHSNGDGLVSAKEGDTHAVARTC